MEAKGNISHGGSQVLPDFIDYELFNKLTKRQYPPQAFQQFVDYQDKVTRERFQQVLMSKDCYFSYEWGIDNHGRSIPSRVQQLTTTMNAKGYSIYTEDGSFRNHNVVTSNLLAAAESSSPTRPLSASSSAANTMNPYGKVMTRTERIQENYHYVQCFCMFLTERYLEKLAAKPVLVTTNLLKIETKSNVIVASSKVANPKVRALVTSTSQTTKQDTLPDIPISTERSPKNQVQLEVEMFYDYQIKTNPARGKNDFMRFCIPIYLENYDKLQATLKAKYLPDLPIYLQELLLTKPGVLLDEFEVDGGTQVNKLIQYFQKVFTPVRQGGGIFFQTRLPRSAAGLQQASIMKALKEAEKDKNAMLLPYVPGVSKQSSTSSNQDDALKESSQVILPSDLSEEDLLRYQQNHFQFLLNYFTGSSKTNKANKVKIPSIPLQTLQFYAKIFARQGFESPLRLIPYLLPHGSRTTDPPAITTNTAAPAKAPIDGQHYLVQLGIAALHVPHIQAAILSQVRDFLPQNISSQIPIKAVIPSSMGSMSNSTSNNAENGEAKEMIVFGSTKNAKKIARELVWLSDKEIGDIQQYEETVAMQQEDYRSIHIRSLARYDGTKPEHKQTNLGPRRHHYFMNTMKQPPPSSSSASSRHTTHPTKAGEDMEHAEDASKQKEKALKTEDYQEYFQYRHEYEDLVDILSLKPLQHSIVPNKSVKPFPLQPDPGIFHPSKPSLQRDGWEEDEAKRKEQRNMNRLNKKEQIRLCCKVLRQQFVLIAEIMMMKAADASHGSSNEEFGQGRPTISSHLAMKEYSHILPSANVGSKPVAANARTIATMPLAPLGHTSTHHKQKQKEKKEFAQLVSGSALDSSHVFDEGEPLTLNSLVVTNQPSTTSMIQFNNTQENSDKQFTKTGYMLTSFLPANLAMIPGNPVGPEIDYIRPNQNPSYDESAGLEPKQTSSVNVGQNIPVYRINIPLDIKLSFHIQIVYSILTKLFEFLVTPPEPQPVTKNAASGGGNTTLYALGGVEEYIIYLLEDGIVTLLMYILETLTLPATSLTPAEDELDEIFGGIAQDIPKRSSSTSKTHGLDITRMLLAPFIPPPPGLPSSLTSSAPIPMTHDHSATNDTSQIPIYEHLNSIPVRSAMTYVSGNTVASSQETGSVRSTSSRHRSKHKDDDSVKSNRSQHSRSSRHSDKSKDRSSVKEEVSEIEDGGSEECQSIARTISSSQQQHRSQMRSLIDANSMSSSSTTTKSRRKKREGSPNKIKSIGEAESVRSRGSSKSPERSGRGGSSKSPSRSKSRSRSRSPKKNRKSKGRNRTDSHDSASEEESDSKAKHIASMLMTITTYPLYLSQQQDHLYGNHTLLEMVLLIVIHLIQPHIRMSGTSLETKSTSSVKSGSTSSATGEQLVYLFHRHQILLYLQSLLAYYLLTANASNTLIDTDATSASTGLKYILAPTILHEVSSTKHIGNIAMISLVVETLYTLLPTTTTNTAHSTGASQSILTKLLPNQQTILDCFLFPVPYYADESKEVNDGNPFLRSQPPYSHSMEGPYHPNTTSSIPSWAHRHEQNASTPLSSSLIELLMIVLEKYSQSYVQSPFSFHQQPLKPSFVDMASLETTIPSLDTVTKKVRFLQPQEETNQRYIGTNHYLEMQEAADEYELCVLLHASSVLMQLMSQFVSTTLPLTNTSGTEFPSSSTANAQSIPLYMQRRNYDMLFQKYRPHSVMNIVNTLLQSFTTMTNPSPTKSSRNSAMFNTQNQPTYFPKLLYLAKYPRLWYLFLQSLEKMTFHQQKITLMTNEPIDLFGFNQSKHHEEKKDKHKKKKSNEKDKESDGKRTDEEKKDDKNAKKDNKEKSSSIPTVLHRKRSVREKLQVHLQEKTYVEFLCNSIGYLTNCLLHDPYARTADEEEADEIDHQDSRYSNKFTYPNHWLILISQLMRNLGNIIAYRMDIKAMLFSTTGHTNTASQAATPSNNLRSSFFASSSKQSSAHLPTINPFETPHIVINVMKCIEYAIKVLRESPYHKMLLLELITESMFTLSNCLTLPLQPPMHSLKHSQRSNTTEHNTVDTSPEQVKKALVVVVDPKDASTTPELTSSQHHLSATAKKDYEVWNTTIYHILIMSGISEMMMILFFEYGLLDVKVSTSCFFVLNKLLSVPSIPTATTSSTILSAAMTMFTDPQLLPLGSIDSLLEPTMPMMSNPESSPKKTFTRISSEKPLIQPIMTRPRKKKLKKTGFFGTGHQPEYGSYGTTITLGYDKKGFGNEMVGYFHNTGSFLICHRLVTLGFIEKFGSYLQIQSRILTTTLSNNLSGPQAPIPEEEVSATEILSPNHALRFYLPYSNPSHHPTSSTTGTTSSNGYGNIVPVPATSPVLFEQICTLLIAFCEADTVIINAITRIVSKTLCEEYILTQMSQCCTLQCTGHHWAHFYGQGIILAQEHEQKQRQVLEFQYESYWHSIVYQPPPPPQKGVGEEMLFGEEDGGVLSGDESSVMSTEERIQRIMNRTRRMSSMSATWSAPDILPGHAQQVLSLSNHPSRPQSAFSGMSNLSSRSSTMPSTPVNFSPMMTAASRKSLALSRGNSLSNNAVVIQSQPSPFPSRPSTATLTLPYGMSGSQKGGGVGGGRTHHPTGQLLALSTPNWSQTIHYRPSSAYTNTLTSMEAILSQPIEVTTTTSTSHKLTQHVTQSTSYVLPAMESMPEDYAYTCLTSQSLVCTSCIHSCRVIYALCHATKQLAVANTYSLSSLRTALANPTSLFQIIRTRIEKNGFVKLLQRSPSIHVDKRNYAEMFGELHKDAILPTMHLSSPLRKPLSTPWLITNGEEKEEEGKQQGRVEELDEIESSFQQQVTVTVAPTNQTDKGKEVAEEKEEEAKPIPKKKEMEANPRSLITTRFLSAEEAQMVGHRNVEFIGNINNIEYDEQMQMLYSIFHHDYGKSMSK